MVGLYSERILRKYSEQSIEYSSGHLSNFWLPNTCCLLCLRKPLLGVMMGGWVQRPALEAEKAGHPSVLSEAVREQSYDL